MRTTMHWPDRIRIDPILRGADIRDLNQLLTKGYQIDARRLDCKHHGAVSAERIYWRLVRHTHGPQDVPFDQVRAVLKCAACGSKRLDVRATKGAPDDALEEPDYSHLAMAWPLVRQRGW
jgi:hypothetical protein